MKIRSPFLNSQGFSVYLIFIGLLLAPLFLSLAWATLVLFKRNQSQHICFEAGLEILSPLAKAANELEKLNPRAKKLLLDELRIKIALAANPVPSAKALLLKQLVQNQRKQKLLALKQKQIWTLGHGQSQAKTFYYKAKHQLVMSTLTPKLAFVTRPASAISPEYIPSSSFEKDQSFVVQHHSKVQSTFKNLNMEVECKINLRKQKKWYALIQKDRA